MPIYGPYSGEPNDPRNYMIGIHWKNEKGYRVIQGKDNFNHYFGGEYWDIEECKLCGGHVHQILTFDLEDPKLSKLKTDSLSELPLVSCLNCSLYWEPQVYKIDTKNKSVEFLQQKDIHNFIQEDEDKIPTPLSKENVLLTDMLIEDIPINRDIYNKAFKSIGREYLCRILGSPLYATDPIDLECPLCKSEMLYIATLGGETYGKSGNIIKGVDFIIGEGLVYFFLCPKCNIVKTEMQST